MSKGELRRLRREAAKLGIKVHWHGYGSEGIQNMVKWHQAQGMDQEAAELASVCSYLDQQQSLSLN